MYPVDGSGKTVLELLMKEFYGIISMVTSGFASEGR
jgi:hypothetical protein